MALKRADAALEDGDLVHAVIRDSGSESHNRASVDITDNCYVEAHMTGTPTGDPIEAEALARTFGKSRKSDDPVIVGSVKINFGHTKQAIIKTAFIFQHRLIPPNLNYKNTNPTIPLEDWKLQVPTVLAPWPEDKPMRASINNFGYGGSNTHPVMERAPSSRLQDVNRNEISRNPATSRVYVYVVSSKDSMVTQDARKRLAAYIRDSMSNGKELSPADLACSVVCYGERIDHYVPIFGSAITNANGILKSNEADWSLLDELMRDEETTRVHQIDLSQPVTVALQMALVDLLKYRGITPTAVTSHSSGGITAAYAVGTFLFEEAMGVVYFRDKLALKHQMISPLSARVLAAGISFEKAANYINDTSRGKVVVTCVNIPDGVTLSEDSAAIDEVASQLEKHGLFARRLKVPLANHSHHMQNMAQDYTNILREILRTPRSWTGAILSSPVTGEILTSNVVLATFKKNSISMNEVYVKRRDDPQVRADIGQRARSPASNFKTFASSANKTPTGLHLSLRDSDDVIETRRLLVATGVTSTPHIPSFEGAELWHWPVRPANRQVFGFE
ncbi:hypothetical protein EAF00_002453 [Botryotinia globosa]|nr:hypothetical protein EAF00_002453 [Botryotinia globosa]